MWLRCSAQSGNRVKCTRNKRTYSARKAATPIGSSKLCCTAPIISPCSSARAARVPPHPGHAIPVMRRNVHPGEISRTSHDSCSGQLTATTTTANRKKALSNSRHLAEKRPLPPTTGTLAGGIGGNSIGAIQLRPPVFLRLRPVKSLYQAWAAIPIT